MTYDPKLKEAMAEMKAVMMKHDIAGAIILVSRTDSEHQIHFPTWSAAQGSLKGIEFEADPILGTRDLRLNESLNMLAQIMAKSEIFWRMMQGLLKEIRKRIDISQSPIDEKVPHRLN